MAFTTGSGGGPQGEINVTPLVDVVLVLLIIFMVVTPLLQVGFDADIPKPIADDIILPPELQEQVVVSITSDGSIFLNQDRVNETELATRVDTIMRKRHEKIAFLAGTNNLEFGRVVAVMDVLTGAGVKRVGIIDPILE